MDKEKYIIFGEDLTTIDVDNVDTSSAVEVQTTTSLVNPITLLDTDSGTAGVIEVQLRAHGNHTWGSHYGTVDAGTYYTINPAGYTVHDTNGKITIITAASDAVYGVTTDTSTAGNNDFRINLLKHIDPDTLGCYPVSNFKGIQLVNDTTTDLYFESVTGDVDDVDVVLVTHGAGKFKQLVEMVNDAMAPAKSGAAVDFFIGGQAAGTGVDDVSFNGNPAVISGLTITLDT